jgi:endonuclease G
LSQHSIHFHGPVTIHIHDGGPGDAIDAASVVDAEGARLFEKKQTFDPDYDGRPGYDADFLGVQVPAPTVRVERSREMLTGFDGKPLVLAYHHYSLAVNKHRRFAMWTAANVDYSPEMRGDETRADFGDDGWRRDARVPAGYQVDDRDFYRPARRIDRGHLVRRDDAAWGATPEERAFANADTYHWTNCTPQHERFNRGPRFRGAWGELENQIKAEAQRSGARLSIFAGPVLASEDPEALGVQYPLRYWKVLFAVEDAELRAYGFILDQSRVVARYGLGLDKELDFEAFVEHQTSLQDIEASTGVAFARRLHEADALAGASPVEIRHPTDLRRSFR